jgi:hypothetical protein
MLEGLVARSIAAMTLTRLNSALQGAALLAIASAVIASGVTALLIGTMRREYLFWGS